MKSDPAFQPAKPVRVNLSILTELTTYPTRNRSTPFLPPRPQSREHTYRSLLNIHHRPPPPTHPPIPTHPKRPRSHRRRGRSRTSNCLPITLPTHPPSPSTSRRLQYLPPPPKPHPDTHVPLPIPRLVSHDNAFSPIKLRGPTIFFVACIFIFLYPWQEIVVQRSWILSIVFEYVQESCLDFNCCCFPSSLPPHVHTCAGDTCRLQD